MYVIPLYSFSLDLKIHHLDVEISVEWKGKERKGKERKGKERKGKERKAR